MITSSNTVVSKGDALLSKMQRIVRGKAGACTPLGACNCCKQAWLLKNSLTRKRPKKLCNRKPYKRLSRFSWTFSIPQILAVLTKMEFFNSHRQFLSQPPGWSDSGGTTIFQQLRTGPSFPVVDNSGPSHLLQRAVQAIMTRTHGPRPWYETWPL